MASLGFFTRTYSGNDWMQDPENPTRLQLNDTYTYHRDTVYLPYFFDKKNYFIGVQSYCVGYVTEQASAFYQFGWGVGVDADLERPLLLLYPNLYLYSNANNNAFPSPSSATLTVSIIVQYTTSGDSV